ncbi:MAG: MFS transporter [Pseudomonadota bacterium]
MKVDLGMFGRGDWIVPIVGMAVAGITFSYIWPLFSLLLERGGYSGFMIGLSATASALTMVVSAPIMPRVLARLGLVPLMVWSAVATALVLIGAGLSDNYLWWILLRLVLGFSSTALFFAAEYWLVEIAPPERRGRVVAIYAIVLSVSYGLGPLLLRWLGLESFATFWVPALIVAASILPILWGRSGAPEARVEGAASPLQTLSYFRSDPLVIWGVVMFGMIEFGALGLLSVWGVRSGMEEPDALALLTWLAVGSMIFQLLMGWAADLYDRRKLLMLSGIVSMIAPLMIIFTGVSYWIIVLCIVLWGGMAVSLYTLALTELGARYDGPKLAAGNAAVVLAYGVGAFAAPALFGQAMDWVDPDGLLYFSAICALAYTLLAIWRITTRPRKPLDIKAEKST